MVQVFSCHTYGSVCWCWWSLIWDEWSEVYESDNGLHGGMAHLWWCLVVLSLANSGWLIWLVWEWHHWTANLEGVHMAQWCLALLTLTTLGWHAHSVRWLRNNLFYSMTFLCCLLHLWCATSLVGLDIWMSIYFCMHSLQIYTHWCTDGVCVTHLKPKQHWTLNISQQK